MTAYLVGPGEPERVAFCLDLVRDRAPLKGLRIVDLACRTGAFSTAFARAGAKVLGIEGRQSNLDHAPRSRARYMCGDVRDLSPALGTFDVALCLGILYHLPADEALGLLRSMRAVTQRFAVLDTHIGLPHNSISIDGQGYHGQDHGESPGHPWSSITDRPAFWFSIESLEDAIFATGWTGCEVISGKGWSGERDDRRWLIIS